jgi:hypothetical protein
MQVSGNEYEVAGQQSRSSQSHSSRITSAWRDSSIAPAQHLHLYMHFTQRTFRTVLDSTHKPLKRVK